MTRGEPLGLASAIGLKHEDFCVAFDMLIETNTILPSAAGRPSLSRDAMAAVAFSAAIAKRLGGSLSPFP
ncbi:hypothetical protein [Rubripirellula reticaptiva]|uniref:hypothetical protein n=1 Tax=Rubripirellula reticaptiva TaxID=2528013 RepID=UPI00164525D9|nr:hypothetical protein [Rubripirellula reticaptiva]